MGVILAIVKWFFFVMCCSTIFGIIIAQVLALNSREDVMPDWFEQDELDSRRQDAEERIAKRERFMEWPDSNMEASEDGITNEDAMADGSRPR